MTNNKYKSIQFNCKIMKPLLSFLFLFFFILLNAQPVKLMTYNIRFDTEKDGDNQWKLRKENVAELIQFYEPAILGIQEGLINQVNYLDSFLVNYKYIGIGRDDGKKGGEYCAIFFDTTKFIMQYQSTFWLSETPDKPSVGWDAAMERICTFGIFRNKKTGINLFVFNAHFDHIGVEARKNAAELILQKIKNLSGNFTQKIILMGDFNLTPEEEPIQDLANILKNTKLSSIKKPYGPEGTFNGFEINSKLADRIDYIFSKNVKVLEYSTIDDRRHNLNYPSDHLPVMVVVE